MVIGWRDGEVMAIALATTSVCSTRCSSVVLGSSPKVGCTATCTQKRLPDQLSRVAALRTPLIFWVIAV